MGIKIADPFSGDSSMFDEKQNFFFGGGRSPGQILKELKNLLPILQISTGEFPDDKRVDQDLACLEKVLKDRLFLAQMIDPDRGIDKNQPARSDGLAGVGERTLVGVRSLPKERGVFHFPAGSTL